MKKLILGCLLALFASGCNDNEPEQKPVELKISFAGENPVEFTVGEQKRLAFTVTGDDLEGLRLSPPSLMRPSPVGRLSSLPGARGMPTQARSMLRRPQLRRKRP